MYDTLILTIHHYGIHNNGTGAGCTRPFLVASVLADGENLVPYMVPFILPLMAPSICPSRWLFVQVKPASIYLAMTVT